MSQYPRKYLQEQLTPAAFLEENPEMSDWLTDIQPGDELWRYNAGGEGGGSGGFVLLRQGDMVKEYTNLHWDCDAPHMLLFWEGLRPTAREIGAARQIDPRLQDRPVTEVREELLASPGCWDAGGTWSYERPKREALARNLGVRYDFRYV